MSVTPGLGAFNKDKVANKFGIQLKNKDTNKQSQQPLTSSTEKKTINTETSTVTKNKTVSDFRVQNESNGFRSNTNTINYSTSSKTSESTRKTLENSAKSKSSIGLASIPTHNERRDSLTSNVNHSKSLNPVNSNQSIKSSSQSSSSSNILLTSKSPDTLKRSSLTPVSTSDRRTSLTSIDRSKSPESSSIKRTSITKTTEQTILPSSSIKQQNIPTTTTKTVAEIEHQKDQPLYKRQPSKTLDNTTSTANKNKQQHEHTTPSTITSKR